MGGVLLAQWALSPDWDFTVVDPFTETVPDGVRLVKERSAIESARFDLLILAIKPQMVDDVMPDYRAQVEDGGVVASIAAGCSVQRLQTATAAGPVIRIMPNLPALIAKGVSGLFASPECSDDHKQSVEALMARAGTAVWVDEEDMLDLASLLQVNSRLGS